MKCKYSAGACTPGTIYGMSGNSDLELVVTGGAKLIFPLAESWRAGGC